MGSGEGVQYYGHGIQTFTRCLASGTYENVLLQAEPKTNHLTIENKMQHSTSTVTPKWYEIPLIAVKQHQPLFPYGGI
jgi:hypothetical protein